MLLAVVTLAIASQTYASYMERTASRQAAKLFSRDVSLARNTAVQRRETVTIRFHEDSLYYDVKSATAGELLRRTYDRNADAPLSVMDLQISGDSVSFNARGVADLSGLTGSLATAVFAAGQTTFRVSFNSLGSTRVKGP